MDNNDETNLDDNTETSGDENTPPSEAQLNLSAFWPSVWDEIKKIKNVDAKNQVLPLARIKKIMKLDEDVKMISAEAPLLFAKASEIFIHELTLRAWVHTEDNKRRTLQKNDIIMAITKYDQFDFLIDIVPREDFKPVKKDEVKSVIGDQVFDNGQYYFQIAQQTLQGSATSNAQQQQPQQSQQQRQQSTTTTAVATQNNQLSGNSNSNNNSGQTIQLQQNPQNILVTNPNTNQTQLIATTGNQQQPQSTTTYQLIHQMVLANGEVTHVPIPLTQSQANLIRMQMQNGSNQQLIIHTGGLQQQLQTNTGGIFLNATQNQPNDE